MAASAGTSPGAGDGAGAPPDRAASSDWLPEYQPQPAAQGAAAKPGPSRLLRLVVILAVVAIVAIVAVWFFLLRGPTTTGEEFLGTWTASTQQGIATVVVSRADDDAFTVIISGSDEAEEVTVPAHLDGAELVITMDDFSQIAGEANAERFRDALEALAGDFRMVFSSVDATHLDLRIVGSSASGQDFDQVIPLVKEAAGTT